MSSVTNEQLEGLSLTELTRLQSRISPLILKKHAAGVAEAEKAIATQLTGIASKYGTVSVAAVAPTGNGHSKTARKAKRKFQKRAPTVIAKYRDPENAERTWSGKGPAPRWMKDSGKPKEFFLAR